MTSSPTPLNPRAVVPCGLASGEPLRPAERCRSECALAANIRSCCGSLLQISPSGLLTFQRSEERLNVAAPKSASPLAFDNLHKKRRTALDWPGENLE